MSRARQTLWSVLPLFALAAVGTGMAMGTTAVSVRQRVFFAALAGIIALGGWLGVRRWQGVSPVLAMFAGVLTWPYLVLETLRELRLAGQLRALVPPEHRQGTFGFAEASMIVASVAAVFVLVTHGVAGPVSQEPAQARITPAPEEPAQPEPEAPRVGAAPAPVVQPPSSARFEPTPEPKLEQEEPTRRTHPRRDYKSSREDAPEEARDEQVEVAAESAPAREEPAPEPAPKVEVAPPPRAASRRYVPGSEMARQQALGQLPEGTYVTSSGRVVMPAPPPPPKP